MKRVQQTLRVRQSKADKKEWTCGKKGEKIYINGKRNGVIEITTNKHFYHLCLQVPHIYSVTNHVDLV